MKKTFRKLSKKIVTIFLLVTMISSFILPMLNVSANPVEYGTGDYSINFDITNNDTDDYTINSVTINGYSWTKGQQARYYSSNDNYTIVVNVTKLGEKIPDVGWGGNFSSYVNKSVVHDENEYTITIQFNNPNHDPGVDSVNWWIQEGFDDPNEPHFDGHAYVLWSCDGGVCYHEFTNIPSFADGKSKFYKDTTIIADNDPSKHFDVDAEYKAWVLPDRFNYWTQIYKEQKGISEINWAQVDPEDIIAEFPPDMREWEEAAIDAGQCPRPAGNAPREAWDVFQWCVDDYYVQAGNLPFIKLQPVGEPEDNNAYVSYGDRNFKVVIYNDDFKGITRGNLSELHYYPSSWTNPFIMRDQFDISGSTKENPAVIDSILLESIVIIRPLEYNDFAIKTIEALDVPEQAVEIIKEANGEFKLVFSSNFYDNVVFKVTDTNDEVSYIQVKRYTIDGWIRHDNDSNSNILTADFYFDREKSYEDFDITAKIVYKDGSTENVKLQAVDRIDDGLGNITEEFEVEETVTHFDNKEFGLKKSVFEYVLGDVDERDIERIYLNAEYKGSTASNYNGAYVGSGEGILANIYHGEEE